LWAQVVIALACGDLRIKGPYSTNELSTARLPAGYCCKLWKLIPAERRVGQPINLAPLVIAALACHCDIIPMVTTTISPPL
jgi:hypothetical protein